MTPVVHERRAKIIVSLVGAAVLVAGAAVVALLVHHHREKQRLVAYYTEHAEALRGQKHTRDPDTPGWKIQPGAAADAYAEALEHCPTWSGDRFALHRARRATSGPSEPIAPHNPPVAPGTNPVRPACLALGLPDDPLDPIVAQLEAGLCDELAQCRPYFQRVAEASRQEQRRSPIAVWDPRSEDIGHVATVGMRARRMAQLARIDAYIAEQTGEPSRAVDEFATFLRFGADLSEGAGILGISPGVWVQEEILSSILGALWRNSVPDDDLAQLAAELDYVSRDLPSMRTVIEGENLAVSALWVADQGAPVPPAATDFLSDRPEGPVERLTFETWHGDVLDDWSSMLAIQDRPYPERAAIYDARSADLGSQPFQPGLDWQWIDAMLTKHDARMRMVQIAVADARYRRETGRVAESLVELRSWDPSLPVVDPLTAENLELFAEDGHRFVGSPARTPERQEELGLVPPGTAYDLGPLAIELPPPR